MSSAGVRVRGFLQAGYLQGLCINRPFLPIQRAFVGNRTTAEFALQQTRLPEIRCWLRTMMITWEKGPGDM